jgi:hypothetical protein
MAEYNTQFILDAMDDIEGRVRKTGSVEDSLLSFAREKNLPAGVLVKLATDYNRAAQMSHFRESEDRAQYSYKPVDAVELERKYASDALPKAEEDKPADTIPFHLDLPELAKAASADEEKLPPPPITTVFNRLESAGEKLTTASIREALDGQPKVKEASDACLMTGFVRNEDAGLPEHKALANGLWRAKRAGFAPSASVLEAVVNQYEAIQNDWGVERHAKLAAASVIAESKVAAEKRALIVKMAHMAAQDPECFVKTEQALLFQGGHEWKTVFDDIADTVRQQNGVRCKRASFPVKRMLDFDKDEVNATVLAWTATIGSEGAAREVSWGADEMLKAASAPKPEPAKKDDKLLGEFVPRRKAASYEMPGGYLADMLNDRRPIMESIASLRATPVVGEEFGETLNKHKMAMHVQKLVTIDPLIRKRFNEDPDDVMGMAKTIEKLAPRAAADYHTTKAFLTQAVAFGGFTPDLIASLTKLERTMNGGSVVS